MSEKSMKAVLAIDLKDETGHVWKKVGDEVEVTPNSFPDSETDIYPWMIGYFAVMDTAFWATEPPTSSGNYHIRCSETEHEPHPVRVFWCRDDLWVNDPDVGQWPLQVYHDNLINCQWQRLS